MASPAKKLDRKVFKKLITDIAAELTESDVRNLAFHNDISSYADALDLFIQLEKLGHIGRDKITELEEILTGINRNDLATKLTETITKSEGRPALSFQFALNL